MNKRLLGRTAGVGSVLAIALSASSAQAYGWKTHSRVVEAATQIMDPSFPSPTTAPPGVDQQLWTQYLADIHAAVPKLNALRTGLPDARNEPATVCGYDPADNMAQIPNVRIQDLNYMPLQGGVVLNGSHVENGGQCSQTPILCETDDPLRLGHVLGYQAAAPDAHLEDTNIWYKPTNALGASVPIKAISYGYNIAVAALVFPVVCLWDLFSGGDCDIHRALDIGSEVNPIDTLWGAIPGFGSENDYKYVGLWHFIDVAAPSGFYNSTRGLHYENAGPDGVPGVVDVAIMVLSSTTGMSLNASKSKGVERYGQFDEVSRNKSQWQAYAIGHTEFSPIDHLAQWGWNQFVANPTTAYGLAWPLHAFGDAAAPQHAAGTTAFGHRPMEDETDHLVDSELLPPANNCSLSFLRDYNTPALSEEQGLRILRIGFDFWEKYRSQFGPGRMPVQAMVTDLAEQTFELAHDTQEGVLYDDVASSVYASHKEVFCPDGCQDRSMGEWALERYRDKGDYIRPFLELSSGAIIAFLTGASQTARDAGANPDQRCPPGQIFDSTTGGCTPGTGNTDPFPQVPIELPAPLPDDGAGGSGSCEVCEDAGDCGSFSTCRDNCCVPNPH